MIEFCVCFRNVKSLNLVTSSECLVVSVVSVVG